MSNLLFENLNLSQEIIKAIKDMGFEHATEIQYKSIPLIKQGLDVIGKSQTGTGKTVAFGVPCIENVDTSKTKCIQNLILCPTRELAVQACEELCKLAKYIPGIKPIAIYGGAPIDRQISKLKTANIVVGTPGRVMDHMRRHTLKLNNIKMIVLDEADEMLSMGFREDIETILTEIPAPHQTILFSATMPPEILNLTKKFQNNPELIEINKKQVTVSNISQCYYNVPANRKMDALNLLLKYYLPKLTIIFCNTKQMVDEITEYLTNHQFNVQGLHGDMKQLQRTKVMNSFKSGKMNILVATDVAARGIDVNNVDYVINYDIPQNTEYYVHRIGRTGRAGKAGQAITICSGRRQCEIMCRLAKLVKAKILPKDMPKKDEIIAKQYENALNEIKNELSKNDLNNFENQNDQCEKTHELNENSSNKYSELASTLLSEGYDPVKIIALLLENRFGSLSLNVKEVYSDKIRNNFSNNSNKLSQYKKIIINIGHAKKVKPNHIVGALTENTVLSGKDIGKIEIFDDKTLISVPSNSVDETIAKMKGHKICGVPVITKVYTSRKRSNRNFKYTNNRTRNNYHK